VIRCSVVLLRIYAYLAAVATGPEVFSLGDDEEKNGALSWGLCTLALHRAESLVDVCLASLQRGLARTGFYLKIALGSLE
jgi:hypothetical protein